MKARIQEALRRRHRKGDEGFTLIELLVVILIIAILAAVGIVALLSALNAGKKSAAKTTARNAITAVKSVQTGLGQQDFTGIDVGVGGAADPAVQEPDLSWHEDATLTATQTTNHVNLFTVSVNRIIVQTRDASGNCFYADLNASAGTMYGSVKVAATAACSGYGAVSNWDKDQSDGWAAG